MKLTEQIIRKQYDLYEEDMLHKNYKRGISRFYNAYTHSLRVLRIKDDKMEKKNRLIKKFFVSRDGINSSAFNRIQSYILDDTSIILRAMKRLEELRRELGYDFGEKYKPFTIGIIAYDYPEGDD